MPTITIATGTTIVSTPISNTTAYLVEGTGTLDVDNGGVVSGLITISSGGQVAVSSGGDALGIVVSSGGTLDVASGGIVTSVGARLWFGCREGDHRGMIGLSRYRRAQPVTLRRLHRSLRGITTTLDDRA